MLITPDQMQYPSDPNTVAVTDLDAYRANLRKIRAYTGPDVRLMAVIKSNAYGHGMTVCARAAADARAAMLGVCFASEGIALRRAGIETPILALGPESFDAIPSMIEHDIAFGLTSYDMLDAITSSLKSLRGTCRVHVKIDTGMGRIGIAADKAPELVEAAWKADGIAVEGIYSHFPASDEDRDDYSRKQIRVFAELLGILESRGMRPPLAHMCNSAGTLKFPEAHFDMVRPGIMTYGLLPYPGGWDILPLEPVLSWRTRIGFVKDVPAGFAVSYGGTFTTRRPSRLATVPVGYGHGFGRFLSNRGRAIVNGVSVPVAGRVCMDQTVFDVTDAGDVRVGDTVTLIGADRGKRITVEEHAEIGGTITHEIVTGITGRVSRTVVETA